MKPNKGAKRPLCKTCVEWHEPDDSYGAYCFADKGYNNPHEYLCNRCDECKNYFPR